MCIRDSSRVSSTLWGLGSPAVTCGVTCSPADLSSWPLSSDPVHPERYNRHIAAAPRLASCMVRLMQSAAVHHLHSFNQFLQHDLSSAVDCALPHECAFDGCHERLQVMLQMTAIAIDYPILNKDPQTIITPRECRERKITYSAPMTASFKCGMNGIDDRGTITRTAGYLPIMVLSNRC